MQSLTYSEKVYEKPHTIHITIVSILIAVTVVLSINVKIFGMWRRIASELHGEVINVFY